MITPEPIVRVRWLMSSVLTLSRFPLAFGCFASWFYYWSNSNYKPFNNNHTSHLSFNDLFPWLLILLQFKRMQEGSDSSVSPPIACINWKNKWSPSHPLPEASTRVQVEQGLQRAQHQPASCQQDLWLPTLTHTQIWTPTHTGAPLPRLWWVSEPASPVSKS